MSVLKVYGHTLSPPSRFVLHFLGEHSIPHEFIVIDLSKGQHLSSDFLKINPNHTIPAIDDDGFHLYESSAIVLYLAEKHNISIGADVKARAKVHQYLHWAHSNVRKATTLAFEKVIGPSFFKLEFSEAHVQQTQKALETALKSLDASLASSPYLGGAEFGIPDISLYSELSQLQLITYDLSIFPNLARWHAEVSKRPSSQKSNEDLRSLLALIGLAESG